MFSAIRAVPIVVIATLLLLGCSSLQGQNQTLYKQLGGQDGVSALTRQLLINMAADDRIAPRFRGVNIGKFKTGLDTYLCSITDGGCVYAGDSIKTIHSGYNYTATEFNALVENLMQAMETLQIPTATQNKLLAKLAPSYQDVVYQ